MKQLLSAYAPNSFVAVLVMDGGPMPWMLNIEVSLDFEV